MPGRCQHRHCGVVMIFGAGCFVISLRALIAMDFIRAVKLCSIDCDERSVAENLKISVNLGMLQKQPGAISKAALSAAGSIPSSWARMRLSLGMRCIP